MFFSAIFPLAILVATAAADLHDSCTCIYNGKYSPALTKAACTSYNAAGYKWGSSALDIYSGRCTATPGGKLAGDQWEEACQGIAKQVGFTCPEDDHGFSATLSSRKVCYANPDQIRGSC